MDKRKGNTDLTEGKVWKVIVRFALPLLVGNLLQQFYNITDSIIVGQFLGKEALAAVSASFFIYYFIISLVIGVGSGTTVVISQLHIIIEVNYGDDERVVHYQPAIDVNKITVSYLLTRMDEYGSENFKIDTSKLFSKEWKALLKTREDMIKANDNILLKDL